jgi:hypothetical protein
MWQVFYHYATSAGQVHTFFFLFYFTVPSKAGLKLLTLRKCGKCSTTVLPLLVMRILFSLTIFSPGFGNGWTQPLNLKIMWQVFYQCATSAGQAHTFFFNHFLYWFWQWLDSNPQP